MESSNLAVATKLIYDSGLLLFSVTALRGVLGIANDDTFFSVIRRLVKAGVLTKIEKDKYLLSGKRAGEFEIANFLTAPSYISFESALNHHGILSQFPHEVTSATTQKTGLKTVRDKTFSYTHLQKSLYWGYEKKDKALIAFPEKALLDQLYLVSKGSKRIGLDELDYSFINPERLKHYFARIEQTAQLWPFIGKLDKYLKR